MFWLRLARLSLVAVAVVSIAACTRNRQTQASTPAVPVDHSSMTAEQHAAMHGGADSSAHAGDTGFAAMQERGKMAMGVDQYTSAHKFDLTTNGGRIELQRDTDDSLGIAQIRAHMKLIQHAFQAGDFSTPEFVHAQQMPGTRVMSQKHASIAFSYADLPRGGEVRLVSSDPEAISAIHEFLEAQRSEHRAGGSGELK